MNCIPHFHKPLYFRPLIRAKYSSNTRQIQFIWFVSGVPPVNRLAKAELVCGSAALVIFRTVTSGLNFWPRSHESLLAVCNLAQPIRRYVPSSLPVSGSPHLGGSAASCAIAETVSGVSSALRSTQFRSRS